MLTNEEFYKEEKITPEQIVELFEGWRYNDEIDTIISESQVLATGHYKTFIYIINWDNPYKIYKCYDYNKKLTEDLLLIPNPPETITEFISDCKRCGIPLIKKKEK